jgi:hypothetical protein
MRMMWKSISQVAFGYRLSTDKTKRNVVAWYCQTNRLTDANMVLGDSDRAAKSMIG